MKVRDIMTSEGLATATLDSTLKEIAALMRDEDVGAIPVLDVEDQLAGIITDRDIVVRAIAEGEDPSVCTAEEILSEELHTIEPDASLEEAASLMARHKIRRLPVVEDGTILGMISLGDISVKAEEEQAAEALEGVSEGVKPSIGVQGQARETRSRGEDQGQKFGDPGPRQPVNRGVAERPRSIESQFTRPQSSGEEVAEEETQYQRKNAQQGGTRAEHAMAGRIRNPSKQKAASGRGSEATRPKKKAS
jgi:CBS domain-containing protein